MNISYQAHKLLKILEGVPMVLDNDRKIVKLTLEQSEYEEWLKVLVALEDIEYGDKPQEKRRVKI